MLITIQEYLFFRCKQLFRLTKDIGIGHLIILFPILVIAVLGVLHLVLTSQHAGIAFVILFLLVGNHWVREDRFFLEQLPLPLFCFFLLDYWLLCSPFLVSFIYWFKWPNLIVLSLGLLILAFIKPPYFKGTKKKKFATISLEWIPLEIFEWRCGLRKNPFSFIVLYVLGLGLSFYAITIPICLLLLALNITNFFQFFENKDLLLAINHDKKLLQKKASKSLLLFNSIMLPHYLLFIVFHDSYQHLGALLIISIIAQLIIVFAIVMKYKSYTFHDHKIYNSLPLAIFVGCLTVPFLWPIPILMIIRFWKKAQENLIYHYA